MPKTAETAVIMGKTPLAGRTFPSNESSPINMVSSVFPFRAPEAFRSPTAIPRSKWLPDFFTYAGARFTVILCLGYSNPLFAMALLTRPAASLTAVSPIPVISKYGSPGLRSVCISISIPCIPLSATVLIFESINIPPISPALLYDLSLSPSHGTLCRQICACIWKGRTLQRSSNVSAFLYPPPLPVCRILRWSWS